MDEKWRVCAFADSEVSCRQNCVGAFTIFVCRSLDDAIKIDEREGERERKRERERERERER